MSKNQETKNKIKESFLKLLKEEDFDTINTKDIMDLAGGARSNFYNYFSDKFQLCTAIMQDELKKIERIINAYFRENSDFGPERIHDLYLICFRHTYENKNLYSALFTIDRFSDFPEMLRKSLVQLLDYRFMMHFGDRSSLLLKDDYRSYMMSTITVSTIEYWVKTDFSLNPEMICSQCMIALLPGYTVSSPANT